MPRRIVRPLLSALAATSLVLTGQAALGSPSGGPPAVPGDGAFRASRPDGPRVVPLGHHDRLLVSPVGGSGRTTLTPLARPGGARPGVFVTSSDRGTSVQAADSAAAPTVVTGADAPATTADEDFVELHFEAIARDGREGIAHVNIFNLETGQVSTRKLPGDADTTCSAQSYAYSDCLLVAPGAYSVLAFVTTMPAGKPSTESGLTIQNLSLVGDPQTKVDRPRDFVFDARKARPVTVRTPGHETKVNDDGAMLLGYQRTDPDGHTFTAAIRPGSMLDPTFYLQPTAQVSVGELETRTRLRLEAPDIRLSAPGVEALHPEYYAKVWFSDVASEFPMYDGHARLRVVDVGRATDSDLAGKDLSGAIAVAERSDDLSVAEQSNAAADAGAPIVAIYNDGPGDNGEPGGTGVRLEVPTVRLNHTEGRALARVPAGARVDVRGEPASPYVYDLVLKEKGRIPADLHQTVRDQQLATQVRKFHGQPTTGSTFSEAAYEFQPGDTFSISTMFPLRQGPRARTEYRIPDPDTRWSYAMTTPETTYNALFPHPPVLRMVLSDSPRLTAYEPGERDELPVGVAPIGAAPNPAVPMQRAGDRMRLMIEGFTDAEGSHGRAYSSDSGMRTHLEVRADGELVAETDNLPSGTVQLPPGDSRVTVRFTSQNPQDWTQLSTGTDTTWAFPSSTAPDGEVVR